MVLPRAVKGEDNNPQLHIKYPPQRGVHRVNQTTAPAKSLVKLLSLGIENNARGLKAAEPRGNCTVLPSWFPWSSTLTPAAPRGISPFPAISFLKGTGVCSLGRMGAGSLQTGLS